ncbi:MAG: hypothetical protein H6670_16715 [Anaerolineaceae bacterium]|nr:hypothetical protein [Anaerolineaceae bacterium]
MRKWGLFLLLIGMAFRVVAQEAACPADVLLAMARASSACYGTERNEACIGGGDVTFQSGEGTVLTDQTGQRVAINDIATITMMNSESPAVAQLQVQASVTDNEGTAMTWLAIGDVTLTNDVSPLPTLTVTLTGSGKLRATPTIDGDLIMELAVNRALVANGRTENGDWLRVNVPNSNDLAWISSAIVTAPASVTTLKVVTLTEPYLRPFQVAYMRGQTTSLCDGQLPSGLLIQSPHPEHHVSFTLNDVPLQIAATLFVSADEDVLTLNVLEGELIAGQDTDRVYVPAGARIGMSEGIASAPEPFGAFEYAGLPLNMLPRRFAITDNISQDDIVTATNRWQQQVESAQAAPPTPTPDATCRYIVRTDSQLYAGPADFYEVVNPILAGSRVYPVQQIADASDNIWYRLRQSSWIRASRVDTLGDCGSIPIVSDNLAPATNTVSLERCEPTNGPLRAGQIITFEFTPPAFDNYGEALAAPRIDPGVVVLNDQVYLRVRASDPIPLGTVEDDERYLRIFRATWTAEPGSYRVRGERLSYIPICYLTIPVG